MTRRLSALEKNLLGLPVNRVHTLVPGLALAALLAWAAVLLSRFIGVQLLGFDRSPVSAVMVAILLGLLLRTLVQPPISLSPGLTFAAKKVLRLGIILLGIRLTIFDVFRLGAYGVPIVVICIAGALLLTRWLGKRLNLPDRLGTLIAVGTSICGVSAILATAPSIEAEDEEVAYAVAVITIFGLLATLAYPYLAHALFALEPLRAGLFLGTSVHDTSQVVGSAAVYSEVFSSPQVLDAATVTKLVRNVFMALVIPFMTIQYSRRSQVSIAGKKRIRDLLPLFVVGFLIVAAVRSVGDASLKATGRAYALWDSPTWLAIHSTVKTWAGHLLVVALAGVGLGTDLRGLTRIGLKPFLIGLLAALSVGVISYAAISLLALFTSI